MLISLTISKESSSSFGVQELKQEPPRRECRGDKCWCQSAETKLEYNQPLTFSLGFFPQGFPVTFSWWHTKKKVGKRSLWDDCNQSDKDPHVEKCVAARDIPRRAKWFQIKGFFFFSYLFFFGPGTAKVAQDDTNLARQVACETFASLARCDIDLPSNRPHTSLLLFGAKNKKSCWTSFFFSGQKVIRPYIPVYYLYININLDQGNPGAGKTVVDTLQFRLRLDARSTLTKDGDAFLFLQRRRDNVTR